VTGHSSQVASIHIHLRRSLAQVRRVPLRLRIGRVLAMAVHTTIPLGTRIRFARFVLAVRFMAMRTFHHTPILAHPFSHSDRVMQYTFQHVIAPV
jgi:hypothetical protein